MKIFVSIMLTAIVCIPAAVYVAAGSRDKRSDGYVTISDKLEFFKVNIFPYLIILNLSNFREFKSLTQILRKKSFLFG